MLHIATERINVDALDRAPVSLVVLIHPATSASLSQISPIRPVTDFLATRIAFSGIVVAGISPDANRK